MEIRVFKNIMDHNNLTADENRKKFKEKNIFVVNILASPGAGKTSVISRIIEKTGNLIDISVLEGDISSDIDALKMKKLGIPVIQINTDGGCHLDANMVKVSVNELSPSENSIFFIENVGNLICPSEFDLGEGMKLLIASVPEGDDKPYKYTPMFEAADAVVLNKIDLMPYVDFDRNYFYKGIRALKPDIPVFEVSCRTGTGMDELVSWLKDKRGLWLDQHTR